MGDPSPGPHGHTLWTVNGKYSTSFYFLNNFLSPEEPSCNVDHSPYVLNKIWHLRLNEKQSNLFKKNLIILHMNFIQIYSKNPLCTAAAVLSSHHFRYFVSALIAKVQECPQWNVTVGELICLLKNYRFPNATSGSNDFLIHHLPIGVDEIIDDHVWRTKKKKKKTKIRTRR